MTDRLLSVDSDTKLPPASVQAAWQTGWIDPAVASSFATAAATKVTKGDLVFNVRDYGAVGNYTSGTSGTNDTAAINAALSAAAAAVTASTTIPNGARVIFPWTLGNGYKTTAAITVPAGVELDMRAPIVYTGSSGVTALTVGQSTAQRMQRHRIMVRRYTFTDWSDEADRGVVIRNFYSSTFEIVQADNFTIGLTCIGDTSNGFSYNDVHLGQLLDNKIAVDCTNDSGGWCNENDFYGGRFVVSSSTNTSTDRVGVRSTSRATTKYYNNANVFHKPSFEIKGAAITGVGTCALMEYATAHSFLKARHESNSPGVLVQQNNSHSNEINFTYSDLGANAPVLVNNSASSSGRVRQQYRAMTEDAMRVVHKVNAMHKRACYYDGSTSVNIPGLTVGTSGTGNTDARAASSITIAADYVEIPTSRFAGFYMSTRNLKRFAMFRDCETGFGGRFIVRCYDSAGSVISTGTPVVTSKIADNPTYTTSYGGVWRLGADSVEPYDFQVSSSVDYVFVGVVGGTAACRIRSLTVASLDPVDTSTWLAFFDNNENYATAVPTAGTWAVGRKLNNAAPSSGNPAFWTCSVAGTPGTWVAVNCA